MAVSVKASFNAPMSRGCALVGGFEREVRLQLLEAVASYLPMHPTAVVFQHPQCMFSDADNFYKFQLNNKLKFSDCGL